MTTDQQAIGEPDPEWAALVRDGERGGDDGMAAVCNAYSRGIRTGVDRVTPEIGRALKALEACERERDALQAALKLANGTVDRRTAQLDEACAEVDRLEAKLREAQDRPWQNQ